MSLFDRILTNANAAAHDEASVMVREQVAFRPFSDRTAPSLGFVCPVLPVGATLYPYQVAAIETIIQFRRAILGHAPGLGKTLMALVPAIDDIRRGGRALVVCPPTLRINWKREIEKFFPGVTTTIVEGQTAGRIELADVIIVGDSITNYRFDDLLATHPTVLIRDEAQRDKSLGDYAKSAKRAEASKALSDAMHPDAIVVTLSGTIVLNHPTDAFGVVRVTGKDTAKGVSGSASKQAYWDRWIWSETIHVGRGRTVQKVLGCKDAQGLNERLREVAYIRVERDDVLDMPDKVWAIRELALNGDLAEYRRAERDFLKWVKDTKSDAEARRAAKAEAITRLQGLWQLSGLAKVKATVDYVLDMTQQGEQVVVMAWHREVVEAINAGLATNKVSTAVVYGGMSDATKDASVQAFRSGQAQVLVANITAAGTGLNLEQAANLVFVQLPWSPGDLIQASDRIYRVTQTRKCTIHVLLAQDAEIDEQLWDVVQAKTRTADGVAAGAEVTMPAESVQEAVLSRFGW